MPTRHMKELTASSVTDCPYSRTLISAVNQLLQMLLVDIHSDVELVTREPGLHAEMRERLRRALDRISCGQSVLESVGGRLVEEAIGNGRCDEAAAMEHVRRAVGLLAEEWPKDYPASAVEWLVAVGN